MIVKTESDGEVTDVYVEAGVGRFEVRLTVVNNNQGTSIIYENSEGVEYSLLEVDGSGAVINEKPKLLQP